jgi:hypothetical protein
MGPGCCVGVTGGVDPRVEEAVLVCQALLTSLSRAEGLLTHARRELACAEEGARQALARQGAVVPITWRQARLDFVASRANLDRLEDQLGELVAALQAVVDAADPKETGRPSSSSGVCPRAAPNAGVRNEG